MRIGRERAVKRIMWSISDTERRVESRVRSGGREETRPSGAMSISPQIRERAPEGRLLFPKRSGETLVQLLGITERRGFESRGGNLMETKRSHMGDSARRHLTLSSIYL
ncbi:hypothetical protein CgunFtcFv8_015903 [Champsocephalus gunnari]|uniref:Uncharacterized protein n=1 Tax=Champsocephalus gunnari TaxID=52237 RepID=A0AAN8H092_CHAGU|nr:hypothetical protein CgunFtcFv8_015903 [Champsocephalus gunnari]